MDEMEVPELDHPVQTSGSSRSGRSRASQRKLVAAVVRFQGRPAQFDLENRSEPIWQQAVGGEAAEAVLDQIRQLARCSNPERRRRAVEMGWARGLEGLRGAVRRRSREAIWAGGGRAPRASQRRQTCDGGRGGGRRVRTIEQYTRRRQGGRRWR
ncbi:hypothetical protein BDY21DRAFT_346631 [Lineolata rhizophorae]|uniref:Uncharacterized protein n=1 Tax=Lineolata rhizophorae TaxID=578093 RepID=A0A6A6NZL7_9PEZI|nr:hypothetical protein BDY21DRAFT_346631 [Lineolata rhizophorae]